MNESEFLTLADAMLKRIESALEDCGADLDISETGSGVFEIEFDDGNKIIVNRHAAAREIWLAARSGGFHFRWTGEAWCDTKTGRELMAALSELVSAQSGETVFLK